MKTLLFSHEAIGRNSIIDAIWNFRLRSESIGRRSEKRERDSVSLDEFVRFQRDGEMTPQIDKRIYLFISSQISSTRRELNARRDFLPLSLAAIERALGEYSKKEELAN